MGRLSGPAEAQEPKQSLLVCRMTQGQLIFSLYVNGLIINGQNRDFGKEGSILAVDVHSKCSFRNNALLHC